MQSSVMMYENHYYCCKVVWTHSILTNGYIIYKSVSNIKTHTQTHYSE